MKPEDNGSAKGKGNGIAHLSSQEKRALLAELLKKRAAARRETGPDGISQKQAGSFDRFSLSSNELEAEAILDPAIRPEGKPYDPQAEPARILLTGATGFLGAFLLHDLLEKTLADIYCLVRCSSPEEGRQRILTRLESYLPASGRDVSRIIPVPGDLSRPRLGLQPEQFERLAGEIDTIYHSAAMVNWIYSYQQLAPANVGGTREILKLASQRKAKPLHYVSTLAVFPLLRDAEGSVVREDDSLDHSGKLLGGYTQSKWVAEKLVTTARQRGMPVSIYRPGMISGHSRIGAWNTGDFTCQMLKSWINTGYVPDLNASMDMTPVDYVSGAIVHLSRSASSLGRVFHLANPQPVDVQELYTWMRSFGYEVKPIPYDEWRSALIFLAGQTQEKALSTLAPILLAGESEGASRWVGTVPRFDCANTLDALADTPIRCPRVDEGVFQIYFSALIQSGFLKAPQSAAVLSRQSGRTAAG